MTHTRAAVARQTGAPLSIETISIDGIRPNELLVEIKAVGICHTDIVVLQGALSAPFPIVLGHEGVGVVSEVGAAVTSLAPGDTVVLTFDSCGVCAPCKRLSPGHCVSFFSRNFLGCRVDGSTTLGDGTSAIHGSFFGQSSFASHVLCNANNAVRVDADIPPELLAPLGCGIQTGAGAVLNSFQLRPGSSIAVIGVGAVGLAAIMAARINDASRIVACDINPARLSLATELGATDALDTTNMDLASALRSTGLPGFDYVLDSTGNPDLIATGIEALLAGGTCGVLGAAQSSSSKIAFNYRDFLLGGKRLVGIIEGDADPKTFIPRLVQFIRDGRLPLDRIVKRYAFDDINDAIADIESGRAVKPVLMMTGIR